MTRQARVAYVHSAGIHPNRLKLTPSVGAELVPADPVLPWLHMAEPPAWRKLLSLVLSAAFFPRRREWDLLIGDGPQHLPVLMKKFGFLRRDQVIVPYLAGEFAYFLATGYYGEKKSKKLRDLFLHWDAYLCQGEMTEEFVKQILPESRHKDVFVFQNFLREERLAELGYISPDFSSRQLVFVGNGPGGFRVTYKGLDLMFEAFSLAQKRIGDLSWTIVGDWSESVLSDLKSRFGVTNVDWKGPVSDLGSIFSQSSLYFHCSRGDAYPNTVLEAMAAGLPALVSDLTGQRRVVESIHPQLVSPVNPMEIADRLIWYFSLTTQERASLGLRGRETVVSGFDQSAATAVFMSQITGILKRFRPELTIFSHISAEN
jgi:glycosyltransferase involved in cell wall biosynthesis